MEVLAAQSSDPQLEDATMQDSTDDMTVDTGSFFESNDAPSGVAFTTTLLDRPLPGRSGNTPTPSSNSGQNTSPIRVPIPNSSQMHQTTHISTQAISSPIPSASPYIVLRSLQSRLLSSLSSLKPPRMDTSHTLHLVQAANSHSADALSAAHRANTLSQQALDIARDAAAVSQECLAAAEQAKTHASAAVSAVEHMGNSESGMLENEWEWKTVIAELRDGLSAMGQWVSERESEEAACRRNLEMAEKERKHRESMESAMRMTSGSLPAHTALTEVPAATGTPTLSFGTFMQTSGPDAHPPVGSRASAEAEADAARRAWGVEPNSPTNTATTANSTNFAPPTTERNCETAEEKRRAVIVKSVADIEEHNRRQIVQEQELEQVWEREQQKQNQGAEIRRAQDLERQKLEVANFHTQERERQEKSQKDEAARRAAEADRLQNEADLLEDQRRKGKELEAIKVDEARARTEKARAERLEQNGLKKQEAEEAVKEQVKLAEQKCEQVAHAAQEQARRQTSLVERRVKEVAAKQAAELKAPEEEARKVAETKAAEDAANAAAKRALEERQALEQQKRREIEEKKLRQEQAELLRQEAEEQRLREEQEKKRQEVMANKQRVIAATSARIQAERAQKEREKNGIIPAMPSESNTIRGSVSTPRTPSTSQSPLTHTHPLPPISSSQQSPTAHIGNLTAKKTVAPSGGDASKSRKALSGGVKLGTTDEVQLRPESPTPSSLAVRLAALESRDKVPPIPKRNNKLNAQVAPQPESDILPAERLSMTQPTAGIGSSLSAIPASNSHADVNIATPSDIQSSGQVKLNGEHITAAEHRTPTPVTPITPSLTISGDGKHPPDNNDGGVPKPTPEPVSVHRRGHDTGNLRVIPKSKATQPSPQAQAANLRFVKDEAGVLWNTYLKADPDVQAKVEPHEDDVFSNAQVKEESRSTSSLIPRRSLEPSPAAPSPPVLGPFIPASSSTAHRLNPTALVSQSRAVHNNMPHSVESRKPATSTSNVAASTVPSKAKLPSFKKHKHLLPDTLQPGLDNDTSNLTVTNKRPNTSTVNALPNDVCASVPKQVIQPLPATISTTAMAASAMSFDSRTLRRDPTMLFEDSSAIAPIVGDGGWDSWDGSPPRFSHNSSTHNQVSSWPDSELARDSGRRKSVPRWGDHYSSTSSRQPLPANSTTRHAERAPSIQDQRSARPVRFNSPQDRTLPPNSPPIEQRSAVLGKRRYREDDNIQGQQNRSIRRQRPEPQLEKEDQVYRPESARTPPLERRPPAPERSNGLQSRIGQREVVRRTADVYRPVYPPDHYRPTATPATIPTQPRSHGYQSTYTPEQSYPPTSTRDSYRPDLLERMEATFINTSNAYHGRGKFPASGNGVSRGRRGRGSAVGNRPLEQRISAPYNNEHLSLARRLESPPSHRGQ